MFIVQDIAVLATGHQGDGPPQPLSMVLMYRREDGIVPAEHKVHRQRAIELSEQYGPDVSCEDAIVEIITTLTLEGLYCRCQQDRGGFQTSGSAPDPRWQ